MRETEKRIRMYQAQLPFAKEKVIASLLIFAFSIAMVAMTTFAWTTLSVSPEVSGATTVITANGNLEIALAGSYETIYETKEVQKKDDNGQLMFDDNGNPIMETVLVYDSNNNPIIKEIKAIPPSASAVGDSLLSIQQRNQTWGNLINLSDPSYGLDQIILRPATLNSGVSLAKKPFVSATYGPDGRVESTTNSEFAYTQYLEIANGQYGFLQSDIPGVKAVSTVLAQPTHIESKLGLYYTNMLTDTIPVSKFGVARENLQKIVKSMDLTYSDSSPLSGLMSVYLNGLLYENLEATAPDNWVLPDSWKNDGKTEYTPAVCNDKDMEQIYAVMKQLDAEVLNMVGEGYIELFYLYQMDTYIDRESYDKMENPEKDFVWPEGWKQYETDADGHITEAGLEDFLNTASGEINKMISKRTKESDKTTLKDFITKIEKFKDIRKELEDAIANLENEFAEGDEIYWYEVQSDINALVNIQTTTINGKTLNEWFANLSANIDTLLGMLKNSADKNNAIVQAGVIRDIDAMLFSNEGGIHIQKVSVLAEIGAIKHRAGDKSWALSPAGISSDQTIYANIKTSAPTKDANNQWNPSVTSEALIGATNTLDTGYVVYSYKALDTYGLAIDFWLRTNVPGASLILEGEVEFEDRAVTKTLADGTVVTLYLVDITQTTEEEGKETETVEMKDVILYSMKDENNNDVWYYEDGTLFVEEKDIYGAISEGQTEAPVIGKITTQMNGEPKVKTEKVAVGYSSANRIWKESDFPVGVDPQYSTTQGAGSCYTFYADPSELNTILGVLERMRVAFIDGSGQLLAIAKLDTQYCFSEYGRHLVPLVIYSDGGEVTITDSITGAETTYSTIMNMPTNTPTMVSALVYLEGTSIENKDVLASADIQGQFNLQFGTVYDEKAMKDETLMNESITLSASYADKSSDDEKGEYVKTVTATIFGLKSSTDADGNKIWPTVTANFTRKISSTQGTVYFPQPLAFTTTDGTTWTCDFTFKTPGDYIMRSITIDGQEWFLNEAVEFSIEGFKIDKLESGYGQKFTFMTADSYVSDRFTLDITASAAFADKMPTTIKGVFTNEDNVNVNLNFTKQSEENGAATWVANINFNSSGTYTLRYLLLDGEYYELPNPFIREVVLGLQTKVWLTSPGDFTAEEEYNYNKTQDIHSFFYMNPNAKHEFAVVLEIYDESGKEIRQLGGNSGVELFYGTMSATLKWNASADNYSGSALTLNSPGVYSFTRVDIPITTGNGSNTQAVTSTLGAPTVRIMSKDPYVYKGTNLAKDSNDQPIKEFNAILAQSNSPRVEVNFDYAASASVYGKFKFTNASGEITYIVLQAEHMNGTDTDDTFVFYIPTDKDGFYQLMEVKLTNVMGKGQHFYQSEDDLRTLDEKGNLIFVDEASDFDNADSEKFASISYTDEEQEALKVKIITSVKNTPSKYTTTYEGGLFMQEYTVLDGNFTVTLVDFDHKPIVGLSDVKVQIKHNVSSMDAYTTTDASTLDGMQPYQNITLTLNGDDKGNYTWTGDNKIVLDGKYTVTLQYTLGTVTNSVTLDGVEIVSPKPTVTITDVTPTESIPTKIKWTNQYGVRLKYTLEDYKTNVLDTENNTVTVYAKATTGSDGDGVSTGDAGFAYPKLKFAASGIDSSTQVTFTIPKGAANKDISVILSGTTEQEVTLGSKFLVTELDVKLVTYTVYGYNGHGNQTISTVTLTKNGIQYTVTLDKPIIIHNPSSVN